MQIEVRNQKELLEALGAGAEALCCGQTCSVENAPAECVLGKMAAWDLRGRLRDSKARGITLDNARAYAGPGAPDFLSSGMSRTGAACPRTSDCLVDSIEGT